MDINFLSAILRHTWLIDQETAYSFIPFINSVLGITKNPIELDFSPSREKIQSLAASNSHVVMGWNIEDAPEGSIAAIPVHGPLMKQDQFCGPAGTASMCGWIQRADNNTNISAIILHIDSPGGTVDGTETLAKAVEDCSTPIVAFVDGMMCSAALWIGSASDHIVASTQHDTIGSVGVALSFADLKPAYEKMGVKFHEVISDLSPEKNKRFFDLLEGKYDQYKKEVLNPLAQHFINEMKRYNPAIGEKYLKGSTYFAKDVTGIFVDKIGEFQIAIEHCNSLSFQSASSLKLIPMKNNFKNLSDFLGLDTLEISEDGSFLTSEQLEAIDSLINSQKLDTDEETQETTQDDATVNSQENEQETESTTEETTAQDQTQEVTEDVVLTELQQKVTSLESTVKDLRKAPGEDTALAVTETDNAASEEVDEFAESYSKAKEFWG